MAQVSTTIVATSYDMQCVYRILKKPVQWLKFNNIGIYET